MKALPTASSLPPRRATRGHRVVALAGALALAFTLGAAAPSPAAAAPVVDKLTLLVPDGADTTSWQIKVWVDTAAEEGIAIELVSDSALLAMGKAAASKIAGLVVPDSAHLKASDALVAAIKQYAYLGGRLMLVYDAGVLDANGFYPLSGNSRFADMVGVDYAFWNNGAGASTMVGFGPVVGTAARLDTLSLPPGKSMPYTPPATLATTTMATTAFVPVTSSDPSGAQVMRDVIAATRGAPTSEGSRTLRAVRRQLGTSYSRLLGDTGGYMPQLRYGVRNPRASDAVARHGSDRSAPSGQEVAARLRATGAVAVAGSAVLAADELAPTASAAADTSLQQISGYAFGPLGYYHYVTTGTYPGSVWLSSPEHGLVAGSRTYGSGKVLFVNMPLGYFKALGTDAAPLHGFLGTFARDEVGVTTMSVQPRAKGGLVFNWHIDDGDDLKVDTKALLDKTSVLRRGPFSIHLTAGPDVIVPGDKLGMNLAGDAASQTQLKRLASIGATGSNVLPAHAIGSHGGWIHDYWGNVANEANSPDLTSLLKSNFDTIEAVTKKKIREYSSPQGNMPLWAVKWLEARGVVGAYMVADTGMGALRSWRDGQRISTKLWTFPVTPFGKYATFEEFEEFGVSDSASGQWLLDLQSFAVNRRTSRLFYAHPPGVAGHLAPVEALLERGDKLAAGGTFAWYTMTQLADFSQRRIGTRWQRFSSGKTAVWGAVNSAGLADQSFLLPKASYTSPWIASGAATITQDATNWIITAESGTGLEFWATMR